MIRIEYEKTMTYEAFVNRFSMLCPAYIKREIKQEEKCYVVLVQNPIDIHHISIADASHILSHPGTYLLKVTDIKIFEGTLS